VLNGVIIQHKQMLEKLQLEGNTKEQELYENEGIGKQKVCEVLDEDFIT
jgi:hypothetical protein